MRQGRAGSRVPPDGFLTTLRARCDAAGALLVVDAIYTGLGRIVTTIVREGFRVEALEEYPGERRVPGTFLLYARRS